MSGILFPAAALWSWTGAPFVIGCAIVLTGFACQCFVWFTPE